MSKGKAGLEPQAYGNDGPVMRIAKYMETQVAELHKKYDMKLR